MAGASEGTKDWRRVLGPDGVEYVYELKRWQSVEGEFIEPPLGSPLAVWLARVRARAADDAEDPLPDAEREALVDAGIELENFSPVWLGELEKFYGLKQHRVTLHDPVAQRAFVEEQRQLAAEGKLDASRAALAKLTCAGGMRRVVALAREVLGGNGILVEHGVAKLFADAEAVYSYEGTQEMNTLIVGRAITGIAAFV